MKPGRGRPWHRPEKRREPAGAGSQPGKRRSPHGRGRLYGRGQATVAARGGPGAASGRGVALAQCQKRTAPTKAFAFSSSAIVISFTPTYSVTALQNEGLPLTTPAYTPAWTKLSRVPSK